MRTIITFVTAAGAIGGAAGIATAQTQLPGLENFTLERRPPPPTPTPVPAPSPSPTPMVTPPPPSATPSPAPVATPSANRPRRPAPARTQAPRPAATPTTSATPTTGAMAAPAPVETTPIAEPSAAATPAVPAPEPVASATPLPQPDAEPDASASGTSGWLPWAGLAALLVALLGGFAWWRSRRADAAAAAMWEEPAVTPLPDDVRETQPLPADLPAPPAATVPPPPSSGTGIPTVPAAALPAGLVTTGRRPGGLVTSTLRPELRLALTPLRVAVDGQNATVEYHLQVANQGRGAARAVAVEAWLTSASHGTREQLATLFGGPAASPMLTPFDLPAGGVIDLPGAGQIAREVVSAMTAGERVMFVPLLAIRVRFADARGDEQAVTAAYLIGRDQPGQDRLAPLPLDRDDRSHARLAARLFEG